MKTAYFLFKTEVEDERDLGNVAAMLQEHLDMEITDYSILDNDEIPFIDY